MTQIQMIALRIADLRDILGLTQEDVANRSQVPLEDYIEYEKGEKDFPFPICSISPRRSAWIFPTC